MNRRFIAIVLIVIIFVIYYLVKVGPMTVGKYVVEHTNKAFYVLDKTATPTYAVKDFIKWSGPNTDLIGGPKSDTLKNCQTHCSTAPECLGFSRVKSAKDTDIAECWFKKDISNPSVNDGTWQTWVRNNPEPLFQYKYST